MFQCLANRNDSSSIATFRVGERYDDVYEKSKGNIARFAIVFARVLDGDQWSNEDQLGIVEIDAVFGEIEPSLLFIPREHVRSVATLCRYVKIGSRHAERRAPCRPCATLRQRPRLDRRVRIFRATPATGQLRSGNATPIAMNTPPQAWLKRRPTRRSHGLIR